MHSTIRYLALEAFKKKKSYDLALIDVKMPKMNGFELCKEIRRVNDKVKVCFATAFDIQKEDEEDIKTLAVSNEKKDKNGARRFIVKVITLMSGSQLLYVIFFGYLCMHKWMNVAYCYASVAFTLLTKYS